MENQSQHCFIPTILNVRLYWNTFSDEQTLLSITKALKSICTNCTCTIIIKRVMAFSIKTMLYCSEIIVAGRHFMKASIVICPNSRGDVKQTFIDVTYEMQIANDESLEKFWPISKLAKVTEVYQAEREQSLFGSNRCAPPGFTGMTFENHYEIYV